MTANIFQTYLCLSYNEIREQTIFESQSIDSINHFVLVITNQG